MAATGDTSAGIEHPWLGSLELLADSGPDGAEPVALFCENETNLKRLYGAEPTTPYPRDGINDHVVSGAPTVNPQRTGTKCAFWYKVTVQPGQTVELRLRLRRAKTTKSGKTAAAFGAGFDQVMAQRQAEADEFYAELTPKNATADEGMVMRQAFGGLLWSKQHPTQPTPPYQRLNGRNSRWPQLQGLRHHVDAGQVGVPVVRRVGPGVPLRVVAHRSPRPWRGRIGRGGRASRTCAAPRGKRFVVTRGLKVPERMATAQADAELPSPGPGL